jgi:hypothetical protein
MRARSRTSCGNLPGVLCRVGGTVLLPRRPSTRGETPLARPRAPAHRPHLDQVLGLRVLGDGVDQRLYRLHRLEGAPLHAHDARESVLPASRGAGGERARHGRHVSGPRGGARVEHKRGARVLQAHPCNLAADKSLQADTPAAATNAAASRTHLVREPVGARQELYLHQHLGRQDAGLGGRRRAGRLAGCRADLGPRRHLRGRRAVGREGPASGGPLGAAGARRRHARGGTGSRAAVACNRARRPSPNLTSRNFSPAHSNASSMPAGSGELAK